jgi:Xaa-Pro dipeptidase
MATAGCAAGDTLPPAEEERPMSHADVDQLFPAHLDRVARTAESALEREGCDGLVVYSGRPGLHFLDDHGPPFKANPHFLHWAPLLDAPDCFVRFLPGRRPLLVFHQPADYWHKPPELPTGEWTKSFDVEVIREPAAARDLLDAGNRRLAIVGEVPADVASWGFSAVNPPALLAFLHYHRAAKTPYELACMREAARLGARAHQVAARAYHDGASEFEVHQAYCSSIGMREQELPYGNIIAFGPGAAVLHYTTLQRRRDVPRDSFLIDAGAQFRGYASDITRTHVARGAGVDPQFVALLEAVESLQQRLCAMVLPGTDYRDIHLAAHHHIAEALCSSGIVAGCDAEQAVQNGLSSVFFPHGIGHLLGLQVHDVAGLAADDTGRHEIPRPPGHRYLRLTRRLEPGYVVTIEPGIYFIDLLLEEARRGGLGRYVNWEAVRRLAPYGGIRIEDDVACTAGAAPENLTRDAFAADEAA